MVMGTEVRDFRGAIKGFQFSSSQIEEPQPFLAQNQNPFLDILNSTNLDALQTSGDGDSNDDAFSDLALTYINQMLMEEDDKVDNFHEHADLRAAEKPFYDILGQKYPPSPIQPPLDSSHNSSSDSPDDSISPHNNGCDHPSSSSSGGRGVGVGVAHDGIWLHDFPEYQLMSPVYPPPPLDFSSQSSFGSVNNGGQEDYYFDGLSDLFRESEPAWQFRRGEEEALKFLPTEDKLLIDLEVNGYLFPSEAKPLESRLAEVKSEKEDRGYLYESRGRKNPYSDDLDLEEKRSVKHTAISFEEPPRSEVFDQTLLCNGAKFPKAISDIREAYHIGPNKSSQNGGQSKGSSGRKGRGGTKQPKKEMVDLRTILIHCAQMVAADDRRSTGELLKQIRKNSSPVGDGNQRLAHYFANGLDARLAGTGSEIYSSIGQKRRTATDYLKAYQLYLAACPFKKIAYYFSNQHVLDITEKATRVHIIDYGIGFGFQWPSLLQCMKSRSNGAPRIRITGIDLPQPGFRPRERLDETGRRLTEYAKFFGVPFEYKGISSRWEDVSVEDLNIDKDEVLIVNCLFMFRYLADETVSVDCPRNMVLNTIRKMKPDIFIHGVVNGSYSAPFFVTRFREALFYFSAIYDMLESNVPREDEQRQLMEREIFGREILDIVACEGSERVERPETYKQWQLRNLRAGFVQRSLSRDFFTKAVAKVKENYNKDFNIDEDGRWLVQGWKGRILFALSLWKPASS